MTVIIDSEEVFPTSITWTYIGQIPSNIISVFDDWFTRCFESVLPFLTSHKTDASVLTAI